MPMRGIGAFLQGLVSGLAQPPEDPNTAKNRMIQAYIESLQQQMSSGSASGSVGGNAISASPAEAEMRRNVIDRQMRLLLGIGGTGNPLIMEGMDASGRPVERIIDPFNKSVLGEYPKAPRLEKFETREGQTIFIDPIDYYQSVKRDALIGMPETKSSTLGAKPPALFGKENKNAVDVKVQDAQGRTYNIRKFIGESGHEYFSIVTGIEPIDEHTFFDPARSQEMKQQVDRYTGNPIGPAVPNKPIDKPAGEIAGRITLAELSIDTMLKEFMPLVFKRDENGNYLRDENGNLITDSFILASEVMPASKGRQAKNAFLRSIGGYVYPVTGSQMGRDEQKLAIESYFPSILDNNATAEGKIKGLVMFLNNYVNKADPKIPGLGQSLAPLTFEMLLGGQKLNLFANPEDRANVTAEQVNKEIEKQLKIEKQELQKDTSSSSPPGVPPSQAPQPSSQKPLVGERKTRGGYKYKIEDYKVTPRPQ